MSTWPWPRPVTLRGTPPAGPEAEDWDHVMPIITPTVPCLNSSTNVDEVNLGVIRRRLEEAREECGAVLEGRRRWEHLLQERPFFAEFEQFLEVTAWAGAAALVWFGAVESRLRHLCLMVRRCGQVEAAHLWPGPLPALAGEGGYRRRAFYIAVRLLQGTAEPARHLEEPLRVFTELCADSARQLSAGGSQEFDVTWQLLGRGQLPQAVRRSNGSMASPRPWVAPAVCPPLDSAGSKPTVYYPASCLPVPSNFPCRGQARPTPSARIPGRCIRDRSECAASTPPPSGPPAGTAAQGITRLHAATSTPVCDTSVPPPSLASSPAPPFATSNFPPLSPSTAPWRAR